MKGLMVTLLILSCTGMVLAQQDNNSGSSTRGGSSDATSFGDRSRSGEAPVVPIVSSEGSVAQRGRSAEGSAGGAIGNRERARSSFDPNRDRGSFDPNRTSNSADSSRTRSTTSSGGTPMRFGTTGMNGSTLSGGLASSGNAATTRRTGSVTTPVNLGLPASAIADLRKFGSVEAPIENPWLDQLTISALNVSRNASRRSIEPEVRGDTLVFRLTENQLDHINEIAFKYDVPERLRGHVRKATIEFPPALLAARSAQRAPLGSSFEADDSRWRLAGDSNAQRTPVQATPWRDSNQNRNANDLARQRELDRLQREEEDRRRAYEYDQMLREKEAREKSQIADQNRLLELQNLEYRAELLRQEQALARTPQGLYPPGRLADNSLLAGQPLSTTRPLLQQPVVQQPVVQPVVQPVSTYETLVNKQKMQQFETRLAQLDSTVRSVNADNEMLRRRLFDPVQNNLVDHQIDRREQRDRTDETQPEFPGRPVISTGGFAGSNEQRNRGDRGFGGELERDRSDSGATAAKDQGWKLLMFIMLLCSVGLNLYLWAIARGSYMRYEELAHELRETFTVTA